MKPKMLLVIVILLSLCACVFVAYGGLNESSLQGRFNPAAPSFAGLRRMFTARLQTSEMRLRSGVLNCSLTSTRLTVQEAGGCSFSIQPDASKTRQLSLVLKADGASIQVRLTQPNALSIDQTLKTGEQIDLDIYRNAANQNAELDIQGCVVNRKENDPDPDRRYVCVLEIKN